ncbi:ribonuclease T2-like [Mortierella sp. NVP41]|nr:ribonuclease T2-like [Mortierella sp. NVP41]
MKLLSLAISNLLSTTATESIISSISTNITGAEPFDAYSCPLNVLSCSPDSRTVNACCLPSMGLIVLAQQWHDGVGPNNAFTLHGLWPDTCAGGHGPRKGCDHRRIYNDVASRLKRYRGTPPGFIDEMNSYWGSFKGQGNNNAFWSHEWSKHGTCISNLAPSCTQNYISNQDVYDYFRQGLDLRSRYDLFKALAEGGIQPGTNPHVEDMHAAIGRAFGGGVDVQINCENGVLNEIWMYFNVKNGNQYVPTSAKYQGSCRGYVAYPVKKRSLSNPLAPHARTLSGSSTYN